MAILFGIRLDGGGDAGKFLGGVAARMRDPRRGLKFIGEEMLLRTHKRMRAGIDVDGRAFARSRRAEQSGGQTLFDRGALAASVNYEANATTLDLFSSDKRARVHQEGLEIRPKKAKFLTIPLRARGGLFSGPALDTQANRTGARASHFKNTFFLRRGRFLLLMQKTGDKTLRALFLLVRSIREKKREWLGYSPADQEMAGEVLGRHIEGDKG